METSVTPVKMSADARRSAGDNTSASVNKPVAASAKVKTIVSPANGATTESGRIASTCRCTCDGIVGVKYSETTGSRSDMRVQCRGLGTHECTLKVEGRSDLPASCCCRAGTVWGAQLRCESVWHAMHIDHPTSACPSWLLMHTPYLNVNDGRQDAQEAEA
eukprot:6196090-Pleurochrysis_carterae.AAC.3